MLDRLQRHLLRLLLVLDQVDIALFYNYVLNIMLRDMFSGYSHQINIVMLYSDCQLAIPCQFIRL